MEHLRAAQKQNTLHADIRSLFTPSTNTAISEVDDKETLKEKMLVCLEQCARKLESLNREMIIRYYVGKGHSKIENRHALADELGISINALSIRACRIRDRLEACIKE